MENIGRKVLVSGIVQGVGFRYFTCKEASKYHLTGHAKNLYCGDVEVLLFGPRDAVEKMLVWLETGPRTATVDKISIAEIPFWDKKEFACL